MRHDLAIVVASTLFLMGSQTRAAADSGSLSQGSQDSQNQPRVQADVGSMGAVSTDPGSNFDLRILTAGVVSDPAVVAKSHDDKDKDKDKDKNKDQNKDGDHRRDGDREKDHDKNGDHHHDGDHEKDQSKDQYPKDWNRDHDWGRGGDCDPGTGQANTPPSPTPEPGTLLLTGLVAASAGLRARRTCKSD